MSRSIPPAGLLLAAVSVLHSTSLEIHAATKEWMKGAGDWSIAGNWSPNGAPSTPDIVSVGVSALAHDNTLKLDTSATVLGLQITDGMSVDTNYHPLTVNGDTTISGSNIPTGGWDSKLRVDNNLGSLVDFQTRDLTVTNGASFVLLNSTANILGAMYVGNSSAVFGGGTLNFYGNSPTAFTLDGSLDIGIFGIENAYTLNQLGSGRIDLDGGVADDHAISISYQGYSLTVNGDALADAFDDTMYVAEGAQINMNLTDGWTLGPTGWFVFEKTGYGADAVLTGGMLTSNGKIAFINGDNVVGRVKSPLVLNPSSETSIDLGDTLVLEKSTTVNGGLIKLYASARLETQDTFTMNSGQIEMVGANSVVDFKGTTTINGGSVGIGYNESVTFESAANINNGIFNVEKTGSLLFKGNTKVFGGAFHTFDSTPANGQVRFNGPTEYKNSSTFTGIARQNGTASVNAPATINAELFDLDGETATTTWNIAAPLTLNAGLINVGNNTFTGTLNLTSTPSSNAKLIVNLPVGVSWIMSGAMHMTGSGFGTVTDVLAGSDVKISGPTTVSFDNAISARATFGSNNITTINSSSSLRLDGGDLVKVNRIEGATFSGAGSLKASANRALTGYGTIGTAIAFGTGELRAEGGVLNLNGPVTSVNILAAQSASTLKFGANFNTSVANRLELNSGTVTGAALTNASGKEIRGNGFVTTSQLINNGTIVPTAGTLAINTAIAPDLDGSSETGRLTVNNAELYVANTPADDLNGLITIGAGGMLRFEQSWGLAGFGILSLNGTIAQPATVAAASQTIGAMVTMPSNARATFNANTYFSSTANLTINPGAQLDIIQDSNFAASATVVGGGTIRNGPMSKMTLSSGSNVGADLKNDGTLEINAFLPGVIGVESYSQSTSGGLRMDIMGVTPGTLFDQLNVAQSATLNGTLTLGHGLGSPAYLEPHEIVHAGTSVNGKFLAIAGIVLSPTKYFAVTYAADSVMVTAAIPGDTNLDGDVNFDDLLTLAQNYLNPDRSWLTGDFTGNSVVNFDDLLLMAQNYGAHVLSDGQIGTDEFANFQSDWAAAQRLVPEPTALSCLGFAGAILGRRRK